MERRLAAIMLADVVGYSRLMGADEAGTLDALRSHREELINPKIAEHHGRVVKLMGDGVLVEFASVVEAVECAVDIQRDMVERNIDIPEDRQIVFRIGINLGDIVIEDDDIHGDGVNVAARLEGLSDPGGICISGKVYEEVSNKLHFGFEDLGPQEVKNIAQPVRTYRVFTEPSPAREAARVTRKKSKPRLWPSLAAGAAVLMVVAGVVAWLRPWTPNAEPALIEKMAFALPDKPSIAVLPFDNLSDDPEQEYFSDGITNDIITDLSKFENLFVIASNSTFAYKDKPVKVQIVSRELGVRYILEGSVQRIGERVRINAQLVDATTGKHLWAQRYDREAQSLFAIQDEIIETIVATLAFKVGAAERERVLRKGTENLDAYDYYLQGREIWFGWTKAANDRARELFEKAIELDPNYGKAYGRLTWVHVNDWRYGWSDDPKASMEFALETAKKTSVFAPDDYESHWNLGFVYLYRREFDRAMAEYKRALMLNPNDADFLVDMAEALTFLGRPEEAIAQMKKAMRINPHHPEWHLWDLGFAYYEAERYGEALQTLKRMSNPPNGVHRVMAAVYVRLGRLDEARAEITELLKNEPDYTLEKAKAFPYKDPARLDRYIDDLRKAGLPE